MADIHLVSCSDAAGAAEKALLLDVRTPAEFAEAHIAGSVLHPLSDLDAAAVEKLAAGKERCIVVCRSGNRARQAAEKLAGTVGNLGVLEGGVGSWEAAGLPLVRGRKTISLDRQVRIAAGSLVVGGVLLGAFVAPWGYALSAFIGAGLIFSGVTDTCGLGMVLAKMPWNTRGCGCSAASCSTK